MLTIADDLDQLIGLRLKELRADCGWSQKRLADELRVEQGTVSKWERGENAMSLGMIRAACRVLRIPTRALLSAAFPDEPDTASLDPADELRRIVRELERSVRGILENPMA